MTRVPSVVEMSDDLATPVLAVLCDGDERPGHLDSLAGRVSVRYTDTAGLGDAVEGAQALLLWDFFSGALSEAWPRATELSWVHVAAAGVDTLLFPALIDSPVVVTNARGVFDRPIAEFVLASILAHAKDMHASWDFQRARQWRHRETRSVAGTTALVVGTGGIGRETARVLRAVGITVRGAGRTARDGDGEFDQIVASCELASHLSDVDHLVLAAPLTDQTRGLVGTSVLAVMKPTAHLVNVGRGPLIVEGAVVEALRAGRLAAASLDVFTTEPLPAEHPIWSTPGVTVSAHMSGDVVGWRDTLARQFVANAEHWLNGEPLDNVIDKRLGFAASASPQKETA